MRIMFTRVNPASFNIAECVKEIDSEIELTEFEKDVLDVPTDYETDCILVLSSHKSRNPNPMLTVHVPGNWNKADFGGKEKCLNIAHASLMKKLIIGVDKYNKKLKLNWPVYLEADHHGPTCKIPILFIEIGCTEKEWRNKTAGKVIANAVIEALDDKKEWETVFCIGEGHYSRKFTKIAVESGYAVGHILPKYQIEDFDSEMFRQGIKKNVEKVSKILMDKELNKWQKEKIRELNGKFKLEIEEV